MYTCVHIYIYTYVQGLPARRRAQPRIYVRVYTGTAAHLCMCIHGHSRAFMYVYTRAQPRIYVCVYTGTAAYLCMCIHGYSRAFMYVYVRVQPRIYVCVCTGTAAHLCTCIYGYSRAFMYAYMCIYGYRRVCRMCSLTIECVLCRMCSLTIECVYVYIRLPPRIEVSTCVCVYVCLCICTQDVELAGDYMSNVFSYCRMCSLTIECVLLLSGR